MSDVSLREVMLCREYDGWAKIPGEICLVEPKMDGFRLCCLVARGTVGYYCRNLSRQVTWGENLGHIGEALLASVPSSGAYLFDGEVVAANWGELSSLVRTKRAGMSDEDKARIRSAVKVAAFDAIDVDGWARYFCMQKHCGGRKHVPTYDIPLEERRWLAHDIVSRASDVGSATGSTLMLASSFPASSPDEMMSIYSTYMDQGYEGAVLKLPGSPYAQGRHAYWLKLKPRETRDMTVTEFVEGQGKHAGRLGAMGGVDELGREVSLGGGYTDVQREWIWANRARLQGHVVEFECQVGNVATARHPNFIRDRADKNPFRWFD